jgi:protein-S-isoprenylcysteine O-methyltransferase Ste14
MPLSLPIRTAIILFPVSEIALAVMKRAQGAHGEDQGSLKILWLFFGMSVGASAYLSTLTFGSIQGSATWIRPVILALMFGGMAIRWVAILTLGRFFTVDVAIHADHQVVNTGLYRLVRHPSYTGLILTFAGLGLSFFNWVSLLAMMSLVLVAILYRIDKEEHALLKGLGDGYADYAARTKRLIPWVI